MKTNVNGNLVTIENPEQYARIYTRVVDVGVNDLHVGWDYSAPLHDDGKLLAIVSGERVTRPARTEWQGGENVTIPAETVPTLVMVFGVLRDDELGELRERAREETHKRVGLDEQIRAAEETIKQLTKQAEDAKQQSATLQRDVVDERQRANRAEARAQKIEEDLAKVRKFFGDKQYNEALK